MGQLVRMHPATKTEAAMVEIIDDDWSQQWEDEFVELVKARQIADQERREALIAKYTNIASEEATRASPIVRMIENFILIASAWFMAGCVMWILILSTN